MRDNPGPRAVLNTLKQLANGYECRLMLAEIEVKQNQFRDYESRLGVPFAHAAYQVGLAELRDQLKAGLPEKAGDAEKSSVAGLAEQITGLRERNTVEAARQRVGTRKA